MDRDDADGFKDDALKFALVKKYEQCELFRTELERSRGRFIVEDQTTFPKAQPDCWGVKPAGDGVNFSGPNVLGPAVEQQAGKWILTSREEVSA